VVEAYQIFLRDTHVLPNDLAMRNTPEVRGGKPIAVWVNLLAFYDIQGKGRDAILLFCPGLHY
jgi:hypothetical protein